VRARNFARVSRGIFVVGCDAGERGKRKGTGVRWASRLGRGAISTNYREGRQRRAWLCSW